MVISNNPYISDLLIQVTFDISGTTPQVTLGNLSTGADLSQLVWAFGVTSPSQTPILEADINDPAITGSWTAYTISAQWPRPFNNIEWGTYSFYAIAKDVDGNVYTSPLQQANICRPFGNTEKSVTTYGLSTSDVKVQCQDAAVFFQDTTYHNYKGTDGDQISSVLRVIYPIDETLTIPDPFDASQYSTALVPITYSSNNYQFVQTSVYDYELAPYTLVRIKYQSIYTFAVWCNVDLMPLVCEINKLADDIISGNCTDVNAAKNKLNLITPKFMLVTIGILQPLTGVNVPDVIEQIKEIGGFDCHCCTAPTGIIPTGGQSVIDGYNFLVNKLGGDISSASNFSTNGNNITLNIGDVSYIVKVASNSPSDINAFAFTSSLSSDGFTKTYSLVVDGTQLATDILNIIKNNAALVTLFNSIVNFPDSGGGTLLVDGSCIFSSGTACDYVFGLTEVPASGTFAGLVRIQTSGVNIPLNFSFNLTNLSALQAYLNGLGLGAFVVTNAGGGNVSITSAANTHSLSGLLYVAATKKYATFASDCTGIVETTANFVIQSIIDYLCELNDSQVTTFQDYEICYIDPTSLQKVTVTVPAGESLTDFILELLARGCNTIDYIIGLGAVNCANIKKIFEQNTTGIMQSNDVFYGTKVGQCAPIYPVEAGLRMMQLGIYNADYVEAFCNLVDACRDGFICDPYTVFNLEVIDGSPANTTEIIVTFSHPQAISNTLRYARTDNTSTPVYTTIPNVLPGDSPKVIAGLPEGSYVIGLTPIYTDGRSCPEVSQNTGYPTSGFNSFSAIFDGTDIIVSYNAPVGMPKVRVNINYPNGGVFSQIYTNTGTDITITPPAGNYGNYEITMTPVYSEVTGYFGQTTAPAIITITPPNNSTLVNNTSNDLAPISMIISYTNGDVTIPFNIGSVASGGGVINFYIAPVQILGVTINFGSGTVGEAYFTAAVTFIPYVGTVSANQVTFTTIDTIVSGATINLIDPSPAP